MDLSALNKSVHLEKFKMDTNTSIRATVIRDAWTVSLDLKDTYLHVPVHPWSRKFLRFAFRGRVYQFKTLPIGLSTSHRGFILLMRAVASWLRCQGLLLLQYLDDWLILNEDRRLVLVHLSLCWWKVIALGRFPKRDVRLNPGQSIHLRGDGIPYEEFRSSSTIGTNRSFEIFCSNCQETVHQ